MKLAIGLVFKLNQALVDENVAENCLVTIIFAKEIVTKSKMQQTKFQRGQIVENVNWNVKNQDLKGVIMLV